MENDTIIAKIEKVRKNNNKLWMKILKLAFKSEEKKAREILRKIVINDSKVTELCSILCDADNSKSIGKDYRGSFVHERVKPNTPMPKKRNKG